MPRRSSASNLHGFLAVDKPAGWTSHDVVARIRRLTGVRRVGHAGTLDPFATGVLVVGVGKATRLIQYVQQTAKRYIATVRLGLETDTLDPEGEVVHRLEVERWPSLAEVEGALASFIGEIEQIPPAHSAIRIQGKRAYERARAGEAVDVPARRVVIHAIDILRYEPPELEIDVRCGSGTYLRSLARDIGRALGTYGYCHALRRTEVGSFTLNACRTLDELAALPLREQWSEIALPPDHAVAHLPSIALTEAQTSAWYHGQLIPEIREERGDATLARAYAATGDFAGLGEIDPAGGLRPVLVFTRD